jgi:ATP-binding cassette, subfamily F, member 3
VSLVVFEKVGLAFGGQELIDELDLSLGVGERVGLIGPNGCGKTTLLRLIAGEQQPDAGVVRRSQGARVGYLPQDITVTGAEPLLEFVLASVPGRAELAARLVAAEAELAALTARGADGEETLDAAARLSELHERLVYLDQLYAPHEAMRILMGLGFASGDRDRSLAEMSGGWRMRALLASLLFQRPDLLLLDEPTNHLDLPSVAWLAGFLATYRGAFILISHDREFLNEQVARVVSFEPEGVRSYVGDYEAYRRQREAEEVILESQARNVARERERVERFIERFRYKATKAKAVQSRVKALERLGDVETTEKRQVARFRFKPAKRAGAEVLRIVGLGKRYGEYEVIAGLDLSVLRGERIGIIGVNGAGKTTLLRIMAGELEPTAGEVLRGHDVRPGYYAQHHAEMLDPHRTVLDQVSSVRRDATTTEVRTLLGTLLFSGGDVDKPVGVLSGGERARVALARLLVDPGNLMLMDEPTNHLDLDSSEALVEALSTFDGTLVFVSHNRSFIRRLATKIWNVEGGRVEIYPGTLDEYMDFCRARIEASATAAAGPAPIAAAPEAQGRGARAEEKARKRLEAERRAERRRLVGPLEGEIAALEARITELEELERDASARIADPSIYQDAAECQRLLAEYTAVRTELETLTSRWTAAQEELEAAERALEGE